ncbi:actin-like ATPase domain-containing protein [Nemania sp. FL0916]|nr:actin-like ATPase domain-containing protein [Nemania sp. FL0916]
MLRKPGARPEAAAGFMRKTSDVPNERWSMKGLMKRIKAKKQSNLDDKLVIGIDFGTTYSGVAWATVDDLEDSEINIISSWPGSRREDGKTPTELFYEYDKVMWGHEVPADADPILWFKLLLLREEDVSEDLRQSDYYIRARRKIREVDKTPTEVVADYLRALWKHTLDTIYKSRSKVVIGALSFHVVITVPAIWKDYARTAMKEAAAQAGILNDRPAGPTTLSFVPEPEAAGLVTLCEYGSMLKTNDVYVICDAGGGTVDLISYKIGDLNPIELHEAVVGTGGLCGGIFIDEQFEHMCKQRLGRTWNNLSQSDIKALIKGEWEYAYKATYTGKDVDRDYPVGVPGGALKGSELNDYKRLPHIRNGRIHFSKPRRSSENIQKVFMSAFSSIESLVDGQVQKAKAKSLSVKGIVLVGGLGASPYLYNYLKSRYDSRNIEVLQAAGMRPRTAICRGAILKGFLDVPSAAGGASSHVSVVSTIARRNLGVSSNKIFVEGVHNAKDKYWDEDEGIWRARLQMNWYLRKGQSVSNEEPIRHEFYRTFATEREFEQRRTIVQQILQCDDDSPPARNNERVNELCEISWKCGSDMSFESLETYYGEGGNKLKKIEYEIVMVPSGASTEFAIYYQQKKVASNNFQVVFGQ